MSPFDSPDLTHLDERGQIRMVEVGHKGISQRRAVAVSTLWLGEAIYQQLLGGQLPKGDALATARLAAIMAVKQTPHLIPLCHTIPITSVAVEFKPDPTAFTLTIEVMVQAQAQTGVEMEALTGAAVAALTIYDMCKSLDKGMIIQKIYLQQKSGGKSGDYQCQEDAVG